MSRLTHTIRIALALNARLDDNAGQPLALWIMPVLIFAFWLPASLWNAAARLPDRLHAEAVDWAWHCQVTALVLGYWLGLIPRWQALALHSYLVQRAAYA